MSILVRFTPASLSADRYDQVTDRVKQDTDWPPDGLQLHVAFGPDDAVKVSEIWDSPEQFKAFGEKLMPILTEGGVEFSGEPEVIPVHNIEQG